MAEIKSIEVIGLETKEDREYFAKKCADFWMYCISKKVSELPLSYEKKVEFANQVIERIKGKEVK